jgi:Cellulase (glycosyl hydrolase family 5)
MTRAQDRVRARPRAGWRLRLILAVVLLICNLVPLVARSETAEAAQGPIAVHSMLQLNSPSSFMQTMFAEAAGMHASAIRLDVAPSLVFTDPSNPPDFSGLDELVALSRHYHLRVIGDLFTIPRWIAACQTPVDTAQMSRCGTDDLADYRSMITQIVARAGPVIRDWEIWNEPDESAFFTRTPQQYAEMLRVAHDAIKAIDPQANVLLGGVSGVWGTSWLAQVFATPASPSTNRSARRVTPRASRAVASDLQPVMRGHVISIPFGSFE